ncbi:hypothetical protein H0A61_02691 [Koleobacter methoxysyntrophicus]|jgi:hypothetical protein|uniref:Uncharacterized protein n=1 Tax=Koleobacter methoxysyntrophicus TaxID=2751313 RepID=A0A8A0RRX9_9FIRM|nr:hypothetical protein [Koleobacter methoxysyntrophicus]MDK2900710.1 hypothetical protein [Thermosipho sp. (in: thermotogales)]QSQ10290.1 hypothetical protein H0A61_02691 [Koleobacter methoxysyntrophicus]
MSKMPDRINIDKKDRNLYNELSKEIFEGKTRKEQFLFAMAFGFKNGVRRSLETKEGFFLIKDLQAEDYALLNAVAITTKGLIILSNKDEVFKIAEEYAHAGIKILVDEMKSSSFGTFNKKLEKDLFELYEEMGLGGSCNGKDSFN